MFVYFDRETRNITGISNSKNDSKDAFIEKDKLEVNDFIEGHKNFIDYYIDHNNNISEKTHSTIPVNINQKIYLIDKDNKDADIFVKHTTKGWIIGKRKNIEAKLYFVVTKKNNPNFLIRTMYLHTDNLDKNYTINFEYDSERNISECSLWLLNKTFTDCSLELR